LLMQPILFLKPPIRCTLSVAPFHALAASLLFNILAVSLTSFPTSSNYSQMIACISLFLG